MDVYQDVNFTNGYYVLENIPPTNIRPITKYSIDVKDNNKITKRFEKIPNETKL